MSILVGLYDDLSTIQQVVKDLEDNGFNRNSIHFATTDDRAVEQERGGFFQSLSNLFGSQPQKVDIKNQNLAQRIASWGVPEQDAQHYAEAVRRGSNMVMLDAPADQTDLAKQIMDRYDPQDIDELGQRWQKQGWQGYDENAPAFSREQIDQERQQYRTRQTGQEGETHIPIVEEEMRVGKREVQKGGVRVFTTVTEKPVEETVNLRDETVHVDRRPADRPASEADLNAAFKEQTFEVTETDEEAVADKRARVTGEVAVSKQVEEHPETVRDTVRRTEVHTEDLQGTGVSGRHDFSSFDTDFHNHYNMLYGKSGHDYNYYQPGYRYGYDLAGMDQYRGRKWSEIEPDARRNWERQHPNSRWDDFKDSIRHSWERATASSTQDMGTDTGTFTGREGSDYDRGLNVDRNP